MGRGWTGWLCGGHGHTNARAIRSAVRRRPSLPRPARFREPIDRHQQRRLVLPRIYTERPSVPQPAWAAE
ncbi:hypothetical protein F750_2845 [Streptomyces sp. PAMC 26508]|nr:hypothetical protein F750_2845 [Streptomyces sp. PAMC 26508]